MRTISRYIKRGVFLLFLLVSFVNIQGQTGNQPVEVTKRRALVGPYCMVNQISSVANVATNYSHLEYITDSDLNNYASITGIKVDALLSPALSVKDTKNTYKGDFSFQLFQRKMYGSYTRDTVPIEAFLLPAACCGSHHLPRSSRQNL